MSVDVWKDFLAGFEKNIVGRQKSEDCEFNSLSRAIGFLDEVLRLSSESYFSGSLCK